MKDLRHHNHHTQKKAFREAKKLAREQEEKSRKQKKAQRVREEMQNLYLEEELEDIHEHHYRSVPLIRPRKRGRNIH